MPELTEFKAVIETAHQMVIAWDGSPATLPASDCRAELYEVVLPTHERFKVLTWDLMEQGESHLVMPEQPEAVRFLTDKMRGQLVANKLAHVQGLHQDLPLIVLQELRVTPSCLALDTVQHILNQCNAQQVNRWRAVRQRGLVTLYDTTQLSLVRQLDHTQSRPGVSEKDETLVTEFRFTATPQTHFNIVNIHRAVRQASPMAAAAFTDHLLLLENELSWPMTTVVIGNANHAIPASDGRNAAYYTPSVAVHPNHIFFLEGMQLKVNVPGNFNVCMALHADSSHFDVLRPLYVLNQTAAHQIFPVEPIAAEEIAIHVNLALSQTMQAYGNKFKALLVQWEGNSRALNRNPEDLKLFFATLATAAQD